MEERTNENREIEVVVPSFKQPAANAFMRSKRIRKEIVLFINLLGEGLTQEINLRWRLHLMGS